MSEDKKLELGTWLGRHQAFGLMANNCSAADAQCLQKIRKEKLYRSLKLTWQEFCIRHAGVDWRTADRIIDRLEEFGASYFNLLKIVPITPAGYRLLAPAVKDNAIEVHGEKIPIQPGNGEKLIEAVRELRKRSQPEATASAPSEPFATVSARLDRCFDELNAAINRGLDAKERSHMNCVLQRASAKVARLSQYI